MYILPSLDFFICIGQLTLGQLTSSANPEATGLESRSWKSSAVQYQYCDTWSPAGLAEAAQEQYPRRYRSGNGHILPAVSWKHDEEARG
jgi:hypothetical protein